MNSLNMFSRKKLFYFRKYLSRCNNFSTALKGVPQKEKKMQDFFFDKEVQSILKKITGINYEIIFKPKKQKLEPYTYEFVTEQRLKELQDIAAEKAVKKLQMPPMVEVETLTDEVLSKDPELQGYLRNKIVFTDVSPSASSKSRVITVRETDGTLRKATKEERFRMNQIYYPIEGRSLEAPKYLSSPHIERLLDEGSYCFLLDSACVQYEPDDEDYHRITSVTYDHINKNKKFDVLRSTRHFGPMAFYFAYRKNIDGLLVDMLEKQLFNDAVDTIKLLYILNPELQTTQDLNAIDGIKYYIKEIARRKSDLELALQTFLEMQENANEKKISS